MSSKARDVNDRAYIGPTKARETSRLRVSSCHPDNSNTDAMKAKVLTLGTAKVLSSHNIFSYVLYLYSDPISDPNS